MDRNQKSTRYTVAFYAFTALLGQTGAALASASPEGGEFVMADWMLLSFLAFSGAALVVFLVALRRGMFSRMEEAKYYLLRVEEPDFYTPDWIREFDDDTQHPNR